MAAYFSEPRMCGGQRLEWVFSILVRQLHWNVKSASFCFNHPFVSISIGLDNGLTQRRAANEKGQLFTSAHLRSAS